MEHLTFKAVTTTTDQGLFEAVISTENADREKDIVSAAAMVTALKKWNRPLPLAWAHSSEAEHIFGSIDTQSAKDVSGEVVVNGQVDMESKVGKEAWRSFKQGTIGFSYGYLPLQAKNRKGGGRHITELDVYEITATPTPMNNDTRVLSTKAWSPETRRKLASQMREMADAMAAEEVSMSEAEMVQKMHAISEELTGAKALTAEAWRLVMRDELRAKGETVDLPPDRFPEVKTKKEFRKLDPHDKLEVYYTTGGDEGNEKAVWSTAYVNDLPDAAFLYIEAGDKDSERKTTPRTKRHFPYKDAEGNIDLPHLRNALSRIPQANLSQSIKDELTSKAQRILDNAQKALSAVEDGGGEEPQKAKLAPQDPLVKEAWDLVLKDRPRLPIPKPEPEPEPLSAAEVQHQAWALVMDTSG